MTPEELAMADSSGGDLPRRTAVATGGWTRGAPSQDEAPVDEALVYAKLAEREAARRARDFDLADDIMDELTNSGVAYLDDNDKTWFAFAPVLGDITAGGGDADSSFAFGPDNNLGEQFVGLFWVSQGSFTLTYTALSQAGALATGSVPSAVPTCLRARAPATDAAALVRAAPPPPAKVAMTSRLRAGRDRAGAERRVGRVEILDRPSHPGSPPL